MFGIPNVDRKVYSKNFLRTVIFSLNYSSNEIIGSKRKEIQEIFDGYSLSDIKGFSFKIQGISQDVEKSDEKIGYLLKSQDGVEINVEQDRINLTVYGSNYKNFDAFISKLSKLEKLFKLLKVEHISNLTIRKINVVEFEKPENVPGLPQDFMKILIKDRLIEDLTFYGNNDFLTTNFKNLVLQDENYFLNLKYGYNSPFRKENKLKHILVDIELSNRGKVILSDSNLNNELELLNSVIFDVFHWVISDEFLKILNGR